MTTSCKWCSKQITRRGSRKPVFCSMSCKAESQKTAKPISRERLFQLYAVDGMGTYQISQLVHRDPKRVFEWLRDFGILTRKRRWEVTPGRKPYHDRAWLEHEYVRNARSASDIASGCDVSENNILFFLHKLGIPRREMDEIRAHKYWGTSGAANPMYGVTGDRNPNWRGGITPERQSFYISDEWRKASQFVWKRDDATCQKCGIQADVGIELHIHHKVSFGNRLLRAEPSNLILLCKSCHQFVHSSKNLKGQFIEKEKKGRAHF